jgi:hypothetical protein
LLAQPNNKWILRHSLNGQSYMRLR